MKISLINMPFANLSMPSLALTQLASVTKEKFGEDVDLNTFYLNMDFAHYFDDISHYRHVLEDSGFMTGIGDWFFRQTAFPNAADNSEEFFERFYFQEDPRTLEIRQAFSQKRTELDNFLDSLIDKYDLASSDLVGFTSLFSQTVASFAMATRLKLKNPDIITCMGGAACEGSMGKTFAQNIDSIDYIFSGPALITFPELIKNIMLARTDANNSICGVFTKSNSTDETSNILGADLDINENIQLDYSQFLDAFETHFENDEIQPVLLFETSRGCYWAEKMVCTFCGLNGLQICYRQMTPDNALKQIQSLEKWMPRCSSFIAVDTAMPRNYLDELFPQLNPETGIKIMYEVRPDLKKEELAVMSKAGVKALQPGIEALSSQSLKLMQKGTTAFRNIAFLKACSHHPIALDWNLLIFSPGETEQTREKYLTDIPLLYHLAPPTGVYPIMFVRHSLYYENPDAYGLDLEPQDFYKLTYPFEVTTIRQVANHFVNRNADTEHMNKWLDMLNSEISCWRERWLGNDEKAEARLCFTEDNDSISIYDSRSGEAVEVKVTPDIRRVLDELEEPLRKEDLQSRLNDLTESDIEEILLSLRSQKLLFKEGERYLSLLAL